VTPLLALDDRPVLVLGLGESGLAIARAVLASGGRVRVADTRAAPPMLAQARALAQGSAGGALELRPGGFAPDLLEGVSLVALSPGLAPTREPTAALLAAARARGLEVVGEIELFARALARLKAETGYAPQVVGITGTNGKTTVTRMCGLLLARAGRRVAVAGNVSPTALDALCAALAAAPQAPLPEVWVLELSSFQLATTRSLVCDAACVLNLTQDHLDWHGSMADYGAAKAAIFGPGPGTRSVQVLNRDDAAVLAMARRQGTVVSFGTGAPDQPDSYGIVHEDGLAWLAWAEDLSLAPRRRKAVAELPGVAAQVHVHRLMPVEALRVRGRHNAQNALAALALARSQGAPLAALLHALRDYAGEPHRVQTIGQVAGVDWIDDSKGTNVGATVAAVEGLGAEGRRLVLILGGDGKGQDFAPLAPPLAAHARAAVLIGRDAPRLAQALAGAPYAIETAADLPAAVRACARLAQVGDAVLLSPACASLDMFRDYAHRAEVFVAQVRALEAAAAAAGPA